MQTISRTFDEVEDVRSLSLSGVPVRPTHSTVVLVEPTFFDRDYVINPYMAGEVDAERARAQWERLRATYEEHVEDLRVLDPATTRRALEAAEVDAPMPNERPDMVFVANHAVPTAEGDGFVLARMATDERAGEPLHFRAWAEREGYDVEPAPAATFEGMGDALWHPGRRLLWAGHGVRSERAAAAELAERLDATVVPLELTGEHYYHLDVSMAPLSEDEVLVQPEAFTGDGLAKIDAVFDTVLEAPADESTDSLAVNLETFGDTVVLGADAPETAAALEAAGYDVTSVPTDEFRKAGGSVCCLTIRAAPAT